MYNIGSDSSFGCCYPKVAVIGESLIENLAQIVWLLSMCELNVIEYWTSWILDELACLCVLIC